MPAQFQTWMSKNSKRPKHTSTILAYENKRNYWLRLDSAEKWSVLFF